jgi:hypothetical protein
MCRRFGGTYCVHFQGELMGLCGCRRHTEEKCVGNTQRFKGVDVVLFRGNKWGLVNTARYCSIHMGQFTHSEDGDTVFLRNVAPFSYAVQQPTQDHQHLHTLVQCRK